MERSLLAACGNSSGFERRRGSVPVLRKEGRVINFEELSYSSDRVNILWEDGTAAEFHSLWLRDNDPANRDPNTGQRLIDVVDLPLDIAIERAIPAKGAVRVFWTDLMAASFPLAWLRAQCCRGPTRRFLQFWRAEDTGILNRFAYPEIVESPKCRLEWLRAIGTRGIAFLQHVPPFDGQVAEIASLIGWIRETNYGRIFDVRAVPNPNNLAYTELALGLHTDNPYRDPVPGLQILHALKSGKGGESLFADGFAIAAALRERDSCAYEILASTPTLFEFSDPRTHLSAERPIIELDWGGAVDAIHYNSRSIAPLRLPSCETERFYAAYRAFALLLRDPAFAITTPLLDGEAVVFDNRRVLHGRTAFAVDTPRHLQGCYLERDGLASNIAVLERELAP